MTRRVWAVALAAVGCCGGMSAGQAPPLALIPPAPAASAPVPIPGDPCEGDVCLVHAAGRPPREVRVLRIAHHSGNRSLADVMETSTATRMTVPLQSMTVIRRAARPVPAPTTRIAQPPPSSPAPVVPHRPSTPKPVATPVAAPRAVAPAVSRPVVTAIQAPSMVARPNYVKEAERAGFTPEALTALSQMSGTARPPAAPAQTRAPSAPRFSVPSAPRTGVSTVPHPSPATRDLKPVGLAAEAIAPARPEFPRPSQVRQLAPEAPRPVARTPDLPVRVAAAAPIRVSAPQPVSVVPAAARTIDPVPIHLVRALAPLPANQMDVEIGPYLTELTGSPRPSVRERAATALAEGRYGWRPEVKRHLVRAAQQDPAPSVRGHCIRILARLGYHETSYLHYLMGCSDSGPPEVRDAARAALGRLSVRY